MENSKWIVISEDELYHYGVKGQKWGVRRFQNTDGSLTEAGKNRYKPFKSGVKKVSKGLKKYAAYRKDKRDAIVKKNASNPFYGLSAGTRIYGNARAAKVIARTGRKAYESLKYSNPKIAKGVRAVTTAAWAGTYIDSIRTMKMTSDVWKYRHDLYL